LGSYNSPVDTAHDFLQIQPRTTYNATQGYGWTTRVASKDRLDTTAGATANTPLRRDFNYSRNGVFRVDLAANTTYYVRTYHANPHNGTYPFVQGAFDVYTNTVLPYAAGNSALQHSVSGISPGTTDLGIFQVTTGTDGVLFLDFRSLGSFLISGVEISVGALNVGNEVPLQAAGDPLDAGAAAIGVQQLQPAVAEASARWLATGLTPSQTATLANVQYAVADLGGALLGSANPATNQLRIDDDAARFGWSVMGDGLPITDHRSPITGVRLLTVVMHELGHLLGYEHSEDGLMAPVLGTTPLRPSSVIPDPGSRIPHPGSRVPHPGSRIPDLGSSFRP